MWIIPGKFCANETRIARTRFGFLVWEATEIDTINLYFLTCIWCHNKTPLRRSEQTSFTQGTAAIPVSLHNNKGFVFIVFCFFLEICQQMHCAPFEYYKCIYYALKTHVGHVAFRLHHKRGHLWLCLQQSRSPRQQAAIQWVQHNGPKKEPAIVHYLCIKYYIPNIKWRPNQNEYPSCASPADSYVPCSCSVSVTATFSVNRVPYRMPHKSIVKLALADVDMFHTYRPITLYKIKKSVVNNSKMISNVHFDLPPNGFHGIGDNIQRRHCCG